MAEVTVSDIPEMGADLEDYVAALFQSAGYFVQKGLIQRDPADVLELDIVASRYDQNSVDRVVVEVKGGKWGYSDLFKVVGWLTYLGMPRGAFFVKSPDVHLEVMKSRMSALGVSLVYLHDFASADETFENAGFGQPESDELIELWRFSYLIERKLFGVMMARSKDNPASDGAAAAKKYYRQINDGTFFSQSPEEAARLLYDAFFEHPSFTAANGGELDGKGYSQAAGYGDSFKQALRGGLHPYLQACMYIEHSARLAILRAGVDCLLKNGVSVFDNPLYSDMPATFKKGLAWLAEQPTYWKYSTLWQQLLWGWGGFILAGRRAEEHQWMAALSGVPVEEVPTALEAFDRFFPTTKGWFRVVGGAEIEQVMLMPWAFKGLGAHHRLQQYEMSDFSWFGAGSYTEGDLVKWLNSTVAFLQ